MTRTILGPFNRVEGDLEVEVDIADGIVKHAWVNSPLYRGFEQILLGKQPQEALTYTPRICGICSVSQSVACASALAQAQGIVPPSNGQLATNLILACENLADHLTHFYLFFMPDFAREVYKSKSWYADIDRRFRAQTGSAAATMLKARAEFMHITGLLAGKWPHTLSIQPGGTTSPASSSDKIQLLGILTGFRDFLETQLFADTLENIDQLDSVTALQKYTEQHPQSHFAQFLIIADDLNLDTLGQIEANFMSYGVYPTVDDSRRNKLLLPQGIWHNGQLDTLYTTLIKEDISHSWMLSQNGAQHPFQGSTLPDPAQTTGYSWCKAPRYHGQIIEVGALARQAIAAHPLILELVASSQSNVRNRVVARLLELARIVPAMERWVQQIKPNEPFRAFGELPDEAEAQGITEAARGSLGHWIKIKNGRILNYQIIAPTTWNFSPRDENGIAGALEQALVGTDVGVQGNHSVAIQHIVRSFDPCMVCTVH